MANRIVTYAIPYSATVPSTFTLALKGTDKPVDVQAGSNGAGVMYVEEGTDQTANMKTFYALDNTTALVAGTRYVGSYYGTTALGAAVTRHIYMVYNQ